MSIEAMKQALEALEKLWNIIDDIDTYGDMAKFDEKLYRSLVERRQRTRFEETGISTDGYTLNGGAITALRQAIEEECVVSSDTSQEFVDEMQKPRHEQEPVGTVRMMSEGRDFTIERKREWVGLTDEDKNDCLVSADPCECLAKPEANQLMEDVESKLRGKNT